VGVTAYDLERLTPGGVKVTHHTGKVETDGPWLILHGPTEGSLDLIVPAAAVVALEPCTGTGRCGHGG